MIVLLLACLVPPPPAAEGALAEALTVTGGCADAFLFAVDSAGSTALVFDADLAERRYREWNLPSEAIDLHLERGGNLEYCTDVLDGDNLPYVDDSWPATAGRAELFVDAPGKEFHEATLVLEDVLFGDDDPERRVDRLVFTATIGWLPG